ncbi:helix-turn-helix domain-containing protein [Rathayibacter rathayi]|nr:helix-turn-helix domain-containing protein [Rathayibacter rathayi]
MLHDVSLPLVKWGASRSWKNATSDDSRGSLSSPPSSDFSRRFDTSTRVESVAPPTPISSRTLDLRRKKKRLVMESRREKQNFVDRGIALQDADAVRWLRQHGSVVIEATALRLFADELRTPHLHLIRIWHSALRALRSSSEDMLVILVPIEGAVCVRSESHDRDWTGNVGEILLVRGADVSLVSTAESAARYEVLLRTDQVPAFLHPPHGSAVVLRSVAPELRALVISTVNVALNVGITKTSPGFTAFTTAILQMLIALLLDSAPPAGPENPGVLDLHRRACAVIASSFPDPELTPAELARRLEVSPSYLRRTFAHAGTTATRELRRARLRLARRYLDDAQRSRQDIATLSGFKDVHALLYALRAQGDTRD